jgi:hypothetical protein
VKVIQRMLTGDPGHQLLALKYSRASWTSLSTGLKQCKSAVSRAMMTASFGSDLWRSGLRPHGLGRPAAAARTPAPVQADRPSSRARTLTPASQHPRVMIGHHRSLLIAGQVNADDRVSPWLQHPDRASRALRLRSPQGQASTVSHDVLLDALGCQARQPHQEDVFTSSTDALQGVTSG